MNRGIGVKSVILAVVGCLIAAFAVEKVANYALQPTMTNDVAAYSTLSYGIRSERYSVLKTAADQASHIAVDPELKKFADFMSRGASLSLSVGVETFQEAESYSGMLKAFMAGLLDRTKGMKGLGMLLDSWAMNPEVVGRKLDERYLPFFKQQVAASSKARVVFWMALFICGGVSWVIIGGSNNKQDLRLEPKEVSVAVELPGVVACPSCGARNRSRGIQSGQKLVCGQCGTILSQAA